MTPSQNKNRLDLDAIEEKDYKDYLDAEDMKILIAFAREAKKEFKR